METPKQESYNIQSIFLRELNSLYSKALLEDHPNQFISVFEAFEYLENKYPSRLDEIRSLENKLEGQEYDSETMYKIVILLNHILQGSTPLHKYELQLHALSNNDNCQKEELSNRVKCLLELKTLLLSYQINFDPKEERHSEPKIESISIRIREFFKSVFSKEKPSDQEDINEEDINKIIFIHHIANKPQLNIEILPLNLLEDNFYEWYESQKDTILKHKELCQLLENEENRNKLYSRVIGTPVHNNVINPRRIYTKEEYQYFINLILDNPIGLLTFEESPLQGAITSTTSQGAISKVSEDN